MHSGELPTRSLDPRRGGAVPALVLSASAVSAGVHLGLAPEHLEQSGGLGFAAAGGLLVSLGLAVFVWPESVSPPLALAVVLATLIFAYAVSRTSGLPMLHPEPENVDAIGLVTKGVEIAALALALRLYVTNRSRRTRLPNERTRRWTTHALARRSG
jgi:hypothetical protein